MGAEPPPVGPPPPPALGSHTRESRMLSLPRPQATLLMLQALMVSRMRGCKATRIRTLSNLQKKTRQLQRGSGPGMHQKGSGLRGGPRGG